MVEQQLSSESLSILVEGVVYQPRNEAERQLFEAINRLCASCVNRLFLQEPRFPVSLEAVVHGRRLLKRTWEVTLLGLASGKLRGGESRERGFLKIVRALHNYEHDLALYQQRQQKDQARTLFAETNRQSISKRQKREIAMARAAATSG